MRKITLISDTHGKLDKRLIPHLQDSDEIWHAGDIGCLKIIEELKKIAPLKAVYGNIDNNKIRAELEETICFKCEEIKILITHIGGYPSKYPKKIEKKLKELKPEIFICGHSHILKVIYDKKLDLLHMNPGACGDYGGHKLKTMLSFDIEKKDIKNLRIIEFSKQPLSKSIS